LGREKFPLKFKIPLKKYFEKKKFIAKEQSKFVKFSLTINTFSLYSSFFILQRILFGVFKFFSSFKIDYYSSFVRKDIQWRSSAPGMENWKFHGFLKKKLLSSIFFPASAIQMLAKLLMIFCFKQNPPNDWNKANLFQKDPISFNSSKL
jgi:hypothetical protein